LSVSVSYINYGKNKHCQHLLIIYAIGGMFQRSH